MKCQKCSAEAPESAKFCPRCHTPLSFECPSCGNRQTHGGTCEKCGIDFVKYASVLIASKKAEADASHERSVRRATLLKNLLLSPITGGIPLIRQLLDGSRKR
jgi:transcription initiation factor IIE alpha subunit